MDMIKELLKNIPIEVFFVSLAVAGGCARYLNGYTNGAPFKLTILFASSFVSGFGGFMFAYLGISMNLPQSMLFVMAGVGGFFSEQTLKLIYERVTKDNV